MVDVAVIGSGPNGLAAAVTMARAGLSVRVYEAKESAGGGTRTASLTLPGFKHDVCSAVHPMALASPFFKAFGLAERIELMVPEISYAHPLKNGRAGIAYRDLDRTVDALESDAGAWDSLMRPLVRRLEGVVDFTQNQLLRMPRDPLAALSFGLRTLEQGTPAWGSRFKGDVAPAMLAGLSAHAIGRLPGLATSGAGLLLGAMAHAGGWPVPRGGSQAIADVMIEDLKQHGGEVVLGQQVESLSALRAETGAKAVIANVTPRALARIAAKELPKQYIRKLESFRYGAGVFKLDLALSGPVPWLHPELAHAPTLHLGGDRAAVALSENTVLKGGLPSSPYVLVSQPSVLDPSRAPAGKHVLWAYTHVPAGSNADRREAILRQIECHAPGIRELIIGEAWSTAAQVESYNANYIGGDISAGAVTIRQLLLRPVLSREPWRTPEAGLYLGSSSTPPGPAVHGMGGWFAAQSALKHSFGLDLPDLAPR